MTSLFNKMQKQIHLKSKTYQVKIVKHEYSSNHVEYIMKIIGAQESFHIQDRYRNIRGLYSRLKEINPHDLPAFPPKKWLGNLKEDFIKARRAALEHFFNILFKNERVVALPEVKQYFRDHMKGELGATIHGEEEAKRLPKEDPHKATGKRAYEDSKERTAEPMVRDGVSDREKCALIVNTIEEKMLAMNYAGGMEESSENLNKNYTRYIQALDRMGKTMKFETALIGLPSNYEGGMPFERETPQKTERRHQIYTTLAKKLEQVSHGVGARAGEAKLVVRLTE